jgi:hypothetical protein
MTKVLLDDDCWRVEQPGIWRALWSLVWSCVVRENKVLNFQVTDKKLGEKWRLTHEEQELLNHLGERLGSLAWSPEYQDKPKLHQKKLLRLLLADIVRAISMNHQGDSSEIEKLGSMSQPEFHRYVLALVGDEDT